MRNARQVAMAMLTVAVVVLAFAPTADALFRLGVEARWVPLAEETMEEGGQEFEPDRELTSLGLGVRGLLGLDMFSFGGKVNFTHHVFSNGDLNYTQFDLNGHIRVRVPKTRLAIFGEAGPTMALDIGRVGYNAALGTEVDVLGWPHIDMNFGAALQYAEVPIGSGPSEIRDHSGFRGMLTVGFDFALHDGG